MRAALAGAVGITFVVAPALAEMALAPAGQIEGLSDFEVRNRALVAVGAEGQRFQIEWDGAAISLTPVDLEPVDAVRFPGQTPDTLASASGGPGGFFVHYSGASERYPHGALGDPVEATGLTAIPLAGGTPVTLALPEDQVFEDLRPGLAELTGGPPREIVTVRSDVRVGAALVAYGLVDRALNEIAATPPIGRANRWLNPIGALDMDGDGTRELAYVETPHIGGTLRLVAPDGQGALVEQASLPGVSNHEFGSVEQGLHAIADLDSDGDDEVIVPTQDRSSLLAVDWVEGGLQVVDRVGLPAPLALDVQNLDPAHLLLGLADGRLMVVRLAGGQ
jgi:hypothetical protein